MRRKSDLVGEGRPMEPIDYEIIKKIKSHIPKTEGKASRLPTKKEYEEMQRKAAEKNGKGKKK